MQQAAVEYGTLDLDTLGQDDSPVSKGTLQNMRNRLIATGMDRVLLARTVQLARATGLFGAKALKGFSLARNACSA